MRFVKRGDWNGEGCMDKDRNFNDIVIYRRLQFGRHTIYKGSLVYNEVLCTVYALNAELPRMR